MALTQIQIIQSLGEAMNWLERELSWGVAMAEQRHLVGRIGELYAALMTSGQMAPETNQAGYDVVSSSGERISVKTTTQSGPGGHMSFNSNTLDQVDRVMVFFLNTEEMQVETLLDCSVTEAKGLFSKVSSSGKYNLSLSKLRKITDPIRPIKDQQVIAEADYKGFTIRELESGSILVINDTDIEPVTKPILRKISSDLGMPIINSNGNPMNTRQLGSRLIKQLQLGV
ncbi:DUF6998 domain-containing protein [Rubritalea profundi]|uniref:DUF6998 domain-containing protein n=1 Tax=Rubritalea profundi TaxID=1658618 RepID=A0A2S7TZ09_9BACT|nr:hypothetical protein [Rubritalea profundi]PQJ27451.1 hypothetical protein BSZ32_02360 [Rubritalea profundi]